MKEFAKRVIRWLATSKVLSFPRKIVKRVVTYTISSKDGVIIYYNDPERSKVLNLIRKIKSETKMLLDDNEAYQIFMAVKRTEKIKGDIAEVGVYKGGQQNLFVKRRGINPYTYLTHLKGSPKLMKLTRHSFIRDNLQHH